MANTKKARAAAGAKKKSKGLTRSGISSSSPLGMLALHLLEQWKKSGRDGIVFLAESENRAERLGTSTSSEGGTGCSPLPRRFARSAGVPEAEYLAV